MGETVYITVANIGEVRLTAQDWPRFVDAIAREVRQLANSVLGAWYSHPADKRQDACWWIEVEQKNRALLRGLLVGVGWQFRQDVVWSPVLGAERLR